MDDNKVLTFIKNNKVHVIIWAVGLVFFSIYIYNQLTAPSYLFHAMLLNTEVQEQSAAKEITDEFIEKYKIETDQGDVLIDISRAFGDEKKDKASSSLSYDLYHAQATDSLNLLAGPTDIMQKIVYESYIGGTPLLAELDTILSESEMKLYEPYFLYVDQAVINKLKDEAKDSDDLSDYKFPDMTKPEKMKTPIPVLINISNSPKLADIYGKQNENVTLGIISGLPTNTLSVNFAEYLLFVEEEK